MANADLFWCREIQSIMSLPTEHQNRRAKPMAERSRVDKNIQRLKNYLGELWRSIRCTHVNAHCHQLILALGFRPTYSFSVVSKDQEMPGYDNNDSSWTIQLRFCSQVKGRHRANNANVSKQEKTWDNFKQIKTTTVISFGNSMIF